MVFNYNILSGYSEHYNESSFSDKLNRFCSSIGKEVVRKVLTLYYVLKSRDVPMKMKITIIGALGYFILPFDLMPDFIVGLGFADDIAAICFAYDQVEAYRTPKIDRKVEERLGNLF